MQTILGHFGYRVTQDAQRQMIVEKDFNARVAFEQTLMEDQQCVFALSFLQLL